MLYGFHKLLLISWSFSKDVCVLLLFQNVVLLGFRRNTPAWDCHFSLDGTWLEAAAQFLEVHLHADHWRFRWFYLDKTGKQRPSGPLGWKLVWLKQIVYTHYALICAELTMNLEDCKAQGANLWLCAFIYWSRLLTKISWLSATYASLSHALFVTWFHYITSRERFQIVCGLGIDIIAYSHSAEFNPWVLVARLHWS